MKKHIKLLKEQAMEWVPNMADPDTKIRLLNAEKFAEFVAAHEREECAKVVDHILKEGGGTYGDAIRARGEVLYKETFTAIKAALIEEDGK